MEIVKIIAIAVAFAVAVWVLYTLVKMSDKAKEERSNEAPYKVEPPMSAEQLALPYKPIEWTFANAPKPKRKYTKRSKYWGSPQHKAKLKKARKAKARKSRKSESK